MSDFLHCRKCGKTFMINESVVLISQGFVGVDNTQLNNPNIPFETLFKPNQLIGYYCLKCADKKYRKQIK